MHTAQRGAANRLAMTVLTRLVGLAGVLVQVLFEECVRERDGLDVIERDRTDDEDIADAAGRHTETVAQRTGESRLRRGDKEMVDVTENEQMDEADQAILSAPAVVDPPAIVDPQRLLKEVAALALGAALGLVIVGAPVGVILAGALAAPVIFEILKHTISHA